MERTCPECGSELWREEDNKGVTYQCHSFDCLSYFAADEIEGTDNAG